VGDEATGLADASAPPVDATEPRHPWLAPGVLVCAAFAFRIVLGHIFTYYGGDAPEYTAIGKNLAAGHGYSIATHSPYVATDIRLPGYPVFLATSFLFSGSHWSVIVLNSLLGAISTLFVWLISRGLHISRTRALWATGISALWLSTASIAGIAQSESLSIPAVLAFVYFILIKPPKSLLWLFVGGSVLAWLVALTRDELAAFVVLVAVVAARRAHLKVLASVALVLCFLLGSGAWLVRNDVQVHRTEYVDSMLTDQTIVATMNGNQSAPLYTKANRFIMEPTIPPAVRSSYGRQVSTYVKETLGHHFTTFAQDKVKYYAEALFPVPIYGLTYGQTVNALGWFLWSLALVVIYALALITTVRWWGSGRRTDVVSLLLFPAFILCFELIFEPQYRFWYPALLLIMPMALQAMSADTYRRLTGARATETSAGTVDETAPAPVSARSTAGAAASAHGHDT
jgi:hypothetical protein